MQQYSVILFGILIDPLLTFAIGLALGGLTVFVWFLIVHQISPLYGYVTLWYNKREPK